MDTHIIDVTSTEAASLGILKGLDPATFSVNDVLAINDILFKCVQRTYIINTEKADSVQLLIYVQRLKEQKNATIH